jgi:hypothetical protein
LVRHDTPFKLKKLRDPDLWLSIAIEQWEWEYSLSISFFDDPGGDPLAEGDTLLINGTAKMKAKSSSVMVRLRILALSALRPEDRAGTKRDSVGALDRIRGGFEGAVGAPDTKLPLIVSMLQANRYRRLELALLKVGRLNYAVQGYYFKHAANDEGGID